MSVVTRQERSWPQFIGWVLCGASASFVLVGAFTVGPFGLLLAVWFAGLALRMKGANVSTVGVIVGPAIWALLIAWLNRDGPGTGCTTTKTSSSCVGQWSPWPFLVVGILLVAAPTFYFATVKRRRPGRPV